MPARGRDGTRRPPVQRWDPPRYARSARFVSELGAAVMALLDPKPGERILDLGCGDGMLTAELAAAGATVVGLDDSAEQVAAARNRGVDARLGDGQELDFADEFDAIFSNAALHWMPDADAVIAGVRRALKPGGRFIAEFGGDGNCARIRRALVAALARRALDADAADTWYFPTPAAYAEKLAAHGFRVRSMELIPRPTPLPGDLADWLETFAEGFLALAPEGERSSLVGEVRAELEPELRDDEGTWIADYVRLRFAADLAD